MAAARDLPALGVVDRATQLLAEVVLAAAVPPQLKEVPPAPELQHHALYFMGVMAFRAARSLMAVVATGYEDQAVVFIRLIDELHNRAQRVRDDASGEYARRWLDGRPIGKPAKLAGQDIYEFLSGPVHANVSGVLNFLAVEQPDGSANVVLGPERRPDPMNGMLALVSAEVRDIAAMLAAASGRATKNVSATGSTSIDNEVRAAVDRYGWLPETEKQDDEQTKQRARRA